jgi:Zn-dependent peptidase ImmA (M78 family)/transcriptional regulator with XRE-family HTH domain
VDVISSRQLGERLADARKRAGLKQAEVAARLGVSRTTVVAIEKGERPPANSELVQMAGLLSVAVHELLREHRPLGLVSPRFRLHGERDNPVITAAVERLRTLARKYVELERITGAARPLSRLELIRAYQVGPETAELDPEFAGRDAAATIRNLLGLGDTPFIGIDERLEVEAGLRLFFLDHIPAHLSALLVWGDDIGACVGINRAHPSVRQRWSMAHEFAHFLRDREAGDIYDEVQPTRDAAEVFADTFTAALLLPEGGVARQFHERRRANSGRFTPVDVIALARYFDASFEATGRRLEELRLLPPGTHDRLMASRSRIGPLSARSPQSSSDLSPHRRLGVPQRYLALAVTALEQEKISEGDFSDFIGVDRVTARGIREEVTGVTLEDGSLLEPLSTAEDLTQ